jgi:hypothetical protein
MGLRDYHNGSEMLPRRATLLDFRRPRVTMYLSPPIRFRIEWAGRVGLVTASTQSAHLISEYSVPGTQYSVFLACGNRSLLQGRGQPVQYPT